MGKATTAGTTLTVSPLDATVRLTSPNGGEFFGTGEARTVTWVSLGVDTVRVSLSANGRTGWVPICEAPAADGTCNWTPDPAKYKVAKRTCKLKIDGFVGALKGGTDLSDGPVGIGPLDVTSPDGGEELVSGDTHVVKWTSFQTTRPVARTVVKYTLDGTNWKRAAALAENEGSCDWTLPVIEKRSTKCLLRVLFYNAQGKLIGQDQSRGPFTMIGAVELREPENRAAVYGGTSRAIRWVTNTSAPVSSVLLKYTLNGGATWNALPIIDGNQGEYFWDVPPTTVPRTKCQVRVVLRNDKGKTVATDIGQGWFTLLPTP